MIICSNCGGSEDLMCLMAAFWVAVDSEGERREPNFGGYEGETELTNRFFCNNCNHIWEEE